MTRTGRMLELPSEYFGEHEGADNTMLHTEGLGALMDMLCTHSMTSLK